MEIGGESEDSRMISRLQQLRTIQLRGEGWSKHVCLKLFLEGMGSGARRNWERQGIPNGRAGRSEPTRAEYSADMWDTKVDVH